MTPEPVGSIPACPTIKVRYDVGTNLWTQEQDDFLRANWETMSDEEMAIAVGHPVSSTSARRGKLGLYHRKGYRGKDWSKAEIDYIRDVWGQKTIPEIARKLGRSINAVRIKTTDRKSVV